MRAVIKTLLLFVVTIMMCLQANAAQTPTNLYNENVDSILFIETETGLGSGVIINEDGTFVTCFHVIANADTVTAKTKSGTKYKVNGFKYINPQKDIAILTITSKKSFKPIKLCTTPVNVGETVYAIGNPQGLKFVFTDGMVNQLSKDAIQFSAPASPGSSGGALLNSKGQLIGIISFQYNPSKAQNINFAVPVSVFSKSIENKTKLNSKKLPWSDFMISRMTETQKKAYMSYAHSQKDLGLLYKCSKPKDGKDIVSEDDYAYWGVLALFGYLSNGTSNSSLVKDAKSWFNKSIESKKNMELSAYSLVLCTLLSNDKSDATANLALLKKYPKSYRVYTNAAKTIEKGKGSDESYQKVFRDLTLHLMSLSEKILDSHIK